MRIILTIQLSADVTGHTIGANYSGKFGKGPWYFHGGERIFYWSIILGCRVYVPITPWWLAAFFCLVWISSKLHSFIRKITRLGWLSGGMSQVEGFLSLGGDSAAKSL